ncbi:MAG TPA: NAD(P)/FAD-dependent oxidoreductase [Vicinamibacterales bacterium]|nr:NAD(P)/FAD-dependent oxidoreductase [Vicinamibacterales bacterium]
MTNDNTTTVDVAVIGGGVTGLASALALARLGASVCVLEREAKPGRATSTHNSGVIHAGLYYPHGSLKAQLCVEGRDRLYRFCETHNVPHARCGKLVIATDEHDLAGLEKLLAIAHANGVTSAVAVDAAFILAKEPNVRAIAGLWSPDTGIVEAEALVKALEHLCKAHDVAIVVGSPVLGASPHPSGIAIQTPHEVIVADTVVNAAGLYADTVSSALGGMTFKIHPCRGEYAELAPSRRHMVNGLVYPLPHASGAGLGVHLAKTTWGTVTLGPTIHYQDSKDDYESGRLALEDFVEPARKLLPWVTLTDLQPGGSGIRAKLHGPEAKFADFLIQRDTVNARVIQASGIDSPGLTSSLAVGERVASIWSDGR